MKIIEREKIFHYSLNTIKSEDFQFKNIEKHTITLDGLMS